MTNYDPTDITPLHEVRDNTKLQALASNMEQSGWAGRPILALDNGDTIQAITGSHRIQAAIDAGLEEIPVYVIDISDHITGDDGNCEVCGEDCWVVEIYEATDDIDRLDVLRQMGDDEAVRIMDAEI